MTPPMLMLRMVSRSSPSLSVRHDTSVPLLSGSWFFFFFILALLTFGRPELELDEEGTRISLTIVDTPGFGDQIDNEARLAVLVQAFAARLG